MKINKVVGTFLIVLSVAVYGLYLYLVNPALGNNFVRIIWTFSYALSVIGMISYVFHRPPHKYPIPEGKVICIVPVYNEDASHLDACIQSLLSQTKLIDSIYIVDDGSDSPVSLTNFSDEVEPIRLEDCVGKQDAIAVALNSVKTHGQGQLVRDSDVLVDAPSPREVIGELKGTIGLLALEQNAGKRAAQAAVLSAINAEEHPFILTVDSDSYLAPRALEYMMREMYNPHVKACTATVLARNYSENLLTKVQDFNYGIGLSITRSSARAFGLLDTTSGACALYRTEIVAHHLEDYMEHGKRHPYGDDRRMALYSLMEGHGKYVPEAIVYTEVPESFRSVWRQRVRWSQGVWSALPYFVTNLGFRRSIFPLQAAILAFIFPIALTLMLYFSLVASLFWVFLYVSFVFLTTYARALFYTVSRFEVLSLNEAFDSGQSKKRIRSIEHRLILLRRLADWIIISPLLALFAHFILIPAQYVALYRVLTGKTSWGTR